MTHTGSRMKSEIKKVTLKEYSEFQRIDIQGNVNNNFLSSFKQNLLLRRKLQERGELSYAIFCICTCIVITNDCAKIT